jgi:hypothetical protein
MSKWSTTFIWNIFRCDEHLTRFSPFWIARVYPKFPDWVDKEINNNNNNNNKHSLRSNTKGYVSKTHYTDSQNSDTTSPSGRELYHLHFSLQAASPETFGYTLVYHNCSTIRLATIDLYPQEQALSITSEHQLQWGVHNIK